jgi:hypothetical protein
VSYKRSTATKVITDTRIMRPVRMNFFGVKVLSNTSGSESILSTRMLHIHTRRAPRSELERFHERPKYTAEALRALRNNLHTWAFCNVDALRSSYLRLVGGKTNREDEIAAPLRVVAQMTGDERIVENLERALMYQQNRREDAENPGDLLERAMERLVARGYRQVSTTHVLLEMRLLAHSGLPVSDADEAPGWDRPEWVGRQLRTKGFIEPGTDNERRRLFGANLRLFTVNSAYRRRVIEQQSEPVAEAPEALDFCSGCADCPYSRVGCEIAPRREAALGEIGDAGALQT